MRSLILLTIIVGSLFGNYEKSYEREQVKTDFNKQETSKYKKETIPTLSLDDLIAKGIFTKEKNLSENTRTKVSGMCLYLNQELVRILVLILLELSTVLI